MSLGVATTQSLSRKPGEVVDALGEDGTHTHVKVRFNVAMKRPSTRIISNKSDGRPSIRKHCDSVAVRRIHQVKIYTVSRSVEHTLAIAEHPEIVTVKVPRVDLTVIRCAQSIGILHHNIHHTVPLEHIQRTPVGCVSVLGKRR